MSTGNIPAFSVVIPVYNEQENIPDLYAELVKYLDPSFEMLWIDDGSKDESFKAILDLAERDQRVKGLSFSRNFGHQAALLAGMQLSKGDTIIIMDGDLQHPPSLLPELISTYQEGFDLVSAKRIHTENISPIKKWSSSIFYRFLNFITDTRIEDNVADFRVFNRKVLESILLFEERELFLRGIFSWIGFKTATVPFSAPARKSGATKYSWSKMAGLGLRGAVSFSFKPLRISLILGALISLIAFAFAVFAIIAYFQGRTVPGWTSTITAIMLLGGCQLMALGLLGEYIAGLISETKKRPLFIIDKKINVDHAK
ncbi:MAG TPA: glycosyltransferase family 2 protein [Chitinophagaceae bacterium]|nr:glycosyltransferase family 2 protein [Chitinophagaceae bacterium]